MEAIDLYVQDDEIDKVVCYIVTLRMNRQFMERVDGVHALQLS